MSYEVREDQLLRERILEENGVNDQAPWEVIARILAERYSCRGYLPDAVPHETIQRILSLAQLSASWCNAQPWQTIVTEGEGTERFRKALYAHADGNRESAIDADFPFPQTYNGVYGTRRKETAWQLYDCVGVTFGDRKASRQQSLENYRFFGAPHTMIITTDSDLGVYGAVDCGIYVGSLLSLMQASGVASIPQAAFAIFSPFIKEFFGLPETRKVVCGISFGYADPAHPANGFRTRRAPQAEVATFVTA
jgi:nitroreductase